MILAILAIGEHLFTLIMLVHHYLNKCRRHLNTDETAHFVLPFGTCLELSEY